MSTRLPLTSKWPCDDQLTGLATGRGQAGAVDDVVQAGLEDLEQVLTGLAGAVGTPPRSSGGTASPDAVGVARLLLLLQLEQVLRLLDAAAAVLAGGYGTLEALSLPTRSVPRRRDFLVMGPV
jgi:hypothetical protein